MKTPTTKLSKQRYRSMRRKLIITASVIGISTIAITGTVSASSLTEPINFNVFQFKEKQVYNLGKLSEEKTQKLSIVEEKVESVISESDEIAQKRHEAEKELETLKSSIEKLSDMFVKIDKYSPYSAGNAYAPGNCTYYVKTMRPDISSYWGNANQWYANAEAQGWNVGLSPKKGAIATTTAGGAGHVAYVVGVSSDQSTVTVREMNYGSLYNMNTRTVYASEFKYIYELN